KNQGRLAESEQAHLKALAMRESLLGAEHPVVAESLVNLGNLYKRQDRLGDAETALNRNLAILTKAFSAVHPQVAAALNNLGGVYQAQGRYADGEDLHRRALEIRAKVLGDQHPLLSPTLRNIGLAELRQKRWSDAYEVLKRAATLTTSEFVRTGSNAIGGGEKESQRYIFTDLVSAAWGVASVEPRRREALLADSFEALQWADEQAAGAALRQMAGRFAAGDGTIASLVREQQDLVRVRPLLDRKLVTLLSTPAARGLDQKIAAARQELAGVDSRLAQIGDELTRSFPSYAELTAARPLALTEAQRLLGADEVMVAFIDGLEDETFVFAVTRDAARWQRVPIGYDKLSEQIAVLRRSLDLDDPEAAARDGQLFDLGMAHDLYRALLQPVADMLKGKANLLVVPSGPLASLPLHLLVTSQPAIARPDASTLDAYAKADWLVRRHAVTVLPSIASLRALRQFAKSAVAARPLVGFADPLFGARAAPAAPSTQRQQRAARVRAFNSYFSGTRANLETLRAGLSALPDTAAELKAVARSVKAADGDLKFGAQASETVVKSLDLTPFRIVYFATHGLVSGELNGLAEPALALSLPAAATDLDDGLLTASEVAQLRLNADWVVLSACNTAAGDKPGADALSGLSRAFFYAGARTLLVSHWRVYSDAAVTLTTSTFAALGADPAIGRAEALRRSMLAVLRDAKSPWQAYPDYWAPFSVVGEGGK
ncbi:MAG: CHAT domain-containing protein, partial [Proteobacteria bacterium]|nr:CHAT domain-containing protein [Pseudomonadota bacterium]